MMGVLLGRQESSEGTVTNLQQCRTTGMGLWHLGKQYIHVLQREYTVVSSLYGTASRKPLPSQTHPFLFEILVLNPEGNKHTYFPFYLPMFFLKA